MSNKWRVVNRRHNWTVRLLLMSRLAEEDRLWISLPSCCLTQR